MADKLAELKAALEGMSNDALKLVLEFSKFLVKKQSDQKGKNQAKHWSAEGQAEGT